MTNVENQMTKEARMTKRRKSPCVFRHSCFLRHLVFDIRHFLLLWFQIDNHQLRPAEKPQPGGRAAFHPDAP